MVSKWNLILDSCTNLAVAFVMVAFVQASRNGLDTCQEQENPENRAAHGVCWYNTSNERRDEKRSRQSNQGIAHVGTTAFSGGLSPIFYFYILLVTRY